MNYVPLKMKPCYKSYLWGGSRLRTEYGKVDAPEITAESWELSGHPDGMSVVLEGEFRGKTLMELGQLDHDGFWGRDCPAERFPVLVKLIDAKENLSIQVHPSDDTAEAELGERGKAEMWYIMDCEPKSSIYFGLSRQISGEEFTEMARNGSICDVLNQVPVAKGDVFFIMPGTIHAIGKGIMIAEIQQSSNTTFRVFDYLRRGADGSLRPLHLERAEKVMDYLPCIPENCKANNTITFSDFTMAEMFTCSYFRAYRLDLHSHIELCCDGTTFHHLLCVDGHGSIIHNGVSYSFERGDSYYLPAKLGAYQVAGACRMLFTRI